MHILYELYENIDMYYKEMKMISSIKNVVGSSIKNVVGTLTILEWVTAIIFLLYILFPIQTPHQLINIAKSPFTLVFILGVTIYLFLYSKPILGVLYILVGYEFLRRSSSAIFFPLMPTTPSQHKMDSQMAKMQPSREKTLEEEMAEKVGHNSNSHPIIDTSTFKPIYDNDNGASPYQ